MECLEQDRVATLWALREEVEEIARIVSILSESPLVIDVTDRRAVAEDSRHAIIDFNREVFVASHVHVVQGE